MEKKSKWLQAQILKENETINKYVLETKFSLVLVNLRKNIRQNKIQIREKKIVELIFFAGLLVSKCFKLLQTNGMIFFHETKNITVN